MSKYTFTNGGASNRRGFLAAVLLFELVTVCVPAFLRASSAGAATLPLALDTAVSVPIDCSPDGELLLLFVPGLQGFELANTVTGERDIISPTPCTGYFATISPDKKFVCFKEFPVSSGRRLQLPTLYDIAQKKAVPLCEPAPLAGNPVISSRGHIAFTVGTQLRVLNPNFTLLLERDLVAHVNVLAFSPDGRRLAFSDPAEAISWLDLDTGQKGAPPAGALRGYQPRFSPGGKSLLARRSNGEFTACDLATGQSKNFGRAHSATWLDEDTVAFVRKNVANFQVTDTQVLTSRLSDGATAVLLSRKGDAAFALNGATMAFADTEGLSVADAGTGLVRKSLAQSRPAPAADSALAAPLLQSEAFTPKNVVTNGNTNCLVNVPYIQQLYDTADSFPGGGSCCNATATLMAIQYYGRLPTHPITCTRGGTHTSNYGFYITSIYSYNGHVFNIASADWSLEGWYGGFGYFLQDAGGSSLQHSTRLKEYIQDHGLTSATDDSATIEKARAEVDANHPVVVLNELTSAGHYITCIGYLRNQHTLLFNDPYGNKAVAYPGKAGASVLYDWPGYNNGYPNINGADRYVYARGAQSANTSFGSYWDLNGATAGAGTAPSGTWDSTSANWSSSSGGTVSTGPWAEQNAYFSAGTDATGSYTLTLSGSQVVGNLYVQDGTVTFNGGALYFLNTGSYFSNYVATGCTAIFNTPFSGSGSPDKWGPGTAVYNGASTCTGYFSLNEGTLALGNNTALSSARLEVGDTTGANVVTLKAADSTARALANRLVFNAVNFNIGAGGNLTFSGPIDVGVNSSAATTIAVSNTLTTFSGVLTNTGGMGKTGPGTLLLSGASANTYGSTSANGNTTVSGGTLKLGKTAGVAAVPNGTVVVNAGGSLLLGAANQIGDAVPMTLNGGAFQSAGFSEQLGTLKVGANSVIDLGTAASVLKFAASSGVAWTGGTILTISNWSGSISGGGTEQVMFGTSSAGLASSQLSQIRFANPPGFPAGNSTAMMLASGEVVPFTMSPSITSQPQGQNAVVGSTVGFSAAAVGIPTPVFQWRCCGTNVPGATAATLMLPGVGLNQAGGYCVVVTNIAGSVTSSNAALAVYSTAAPTLAGTCIVDKGQFQFNLTGVPGFRYAIFTSTDLVTWTALQTNSSPFTFNDLCSPAFPQRFYRAAYLP